MKKFLIALMLITTLPLTYGQQGGEKVYQFLNTPSSARMAALGGLQSALGDNDINLIFNNPATLSDTMSNHLTFTVAPYIDDITSGAFAFAHNFKNIGTFAIGLSYVNYGSFDRIDENGIELGTFKASDYSFLATYSRAFGPNWYGAMSIKPVLSHLESYQSFGIAIDAGVIYRSSDGLLTAGAALRNIGSQITAYHEDDNTHSLTPDLQAGISYKPQHAPFRFSLTMQDLTNWNHNKIVSKNSNGEFKTIKNGSFAKELVHHAIFGMEFIPIRNFYIATGYNIARRNELKGSIKTGSTGWTWGAGFRVYKFHVAYGSARYHLGGRTNFFTLSTNLSAF